MSSTVGPSTPADTAQLSREEQLRIWQEQRRAKQGNRTTVSTATPNPTAQTKRVKVRVRNPATNTKATTPGENPAERLYKQQTVASRLKANTTPNSHQNGNLPQRSSQNTKDSTLPPSSLPRLHPKSLPLSNIPRRKSEPINSYHVLRENSSVHNAPTNFKKKVASSSLVDLSKPIHHCSKFNYSKHTSHTPQKDLTMLIIDMRQNIDAVLSPLSCAVPSPITISSNRRRRPAHYNISTTTTTTSHSSSSFEDTELSTNIHVNDENDADSWQNSFHFGEGVPPSPIRVNGNDDKNATTKKSYQHLCETNTTPSNVRELGETEPLEKDSIDPATPGESNLLPCHVDQCYSPNSNRDLEQHTPWVQDCCHENTESTVEANRVTSVHSLSLPNGDNEDNRTHESFSKTDISNSLVTFTSNDVEKGNLFEQNNAMEGITDDKDGNESDDNPDDEIDPLFDWRQNLSPIMQDDRNVLQRKRRTDASMLILPIPSPMDETEPDENSHHHTESKIPDHMEVRNSFVVDRQQRRRQRIDISEDAVLTERPECNEDTDDESSASTFKRKVEDCDDEDIDSSDIDQVVQWEDASAQQMPESRQGDDEEKENLSGLAGDLSSVQEGSSQDSVSPPMFPDAALRINGRTTLVAIREDIVDSEVSLTNMEDEKCVLCKVKAKEVLNLQAQLSELRWRADNAAVNNKKLQNQLYAMRKNYEGRVSPFRRIFEEVRACHCPGEKIGKQTNALTL